MARPTRGVLLIAGENYPPWTSPGSIRLARTSELLIDHGWRPVVLTCRPPRRLSIRLPVPAVKGLEIRRTAEIDPIKALFARPELRRRTGTRSVAERSDLRPRLVGAARAAYVAANFPDRDWLWAPVAVAAGMRVLRRQDLAIEAVYSTSPSITSHVVARWLKRLSDVAWIAEFRDTWAWSTIRPPRGRLRASLERRLERRICAEADRVVSVAQGYLDELNDVHGLDPSRTSIVLNGFDPRDFAELPRPERFDRFSLAHAGQLYGGRRGLRIVLEAIRSLADEGRLPLETISLDLYGEPDALVDAEIESFDLGAQTTWHGYVSYPELLPALARSYLLLLLTHEARPTLPSKLFDYIGVNRPTIAVAHQPGDVASILQRTGRGKVVVHDDLARMREVLMEHWTRWRRGGAADSNGDTTDEQAAVAEYTRQHQIARLARLLDEACQGRAALRTTAGRPRPTASAAGRHG